MGSRYNFMRSNELFLLIQLKKSR